MLLGNWSPIGTNLTHVKGDSTVKLEKFQAKWTRVPDMLYILEFKAPVGT
jgi:hypothetical protein